MRNIIQFKSILNLKNQKWKGGNPIFHKILAKNSRLKILFKFIIYKYEINKKIDPNAWIKKYFIPNIWGFNFISKEIKGTKAIKLISIKLHVKRNLFIEIPKTEEINKINIKDLFLNHEIYLVV